MNKYIMDNDIQIKENKKYYYVISYYRPSNDFIRSNLMNTDISIFELDEWNELLNKSKIYNKCVKILNDESDYGYHFEKPEYRRAVYYLYYNCNYCEYNDFTSLEYYVGYDKDIYERVFIETKNEDRYNVSINSFRSWIVKHYDEFNKNYDIIKIYGDELYNIPKKELICDSCNTQIISLENQCDFCDRKMCETCQMNSYYSFHYCNECGTNYCYYNGLGDDYKCLKAKYSKGCSDCGF
jgi:hypothetical protein